MKVFKKFLSLCLVIASLLSLNLMAFAAEIETEESGDCEISIMISDRSGGYPEESIKLVFKNGEGEEKGGAEFTKENWLRAKMEKLTLPAGEIYTLAFEDMATGYVVVDALSGEPMETNFATPIGAKECHWSIITKEQLTAQQKAGSEGREDIKVNNKEAEKAYRAFLAEVAFIETDESWYTGIAATLNQYGENSINRNTYSEWYAKYVQGGSVEEYFALSAYEQFLWTETYTRLANAVNSEWGFSHYFDSKKTFDATITSIAAAMMNGEGNENVKRAYYKLMEWQYGYITENGYPFNFINNRSYIEELRSQPTGDKEDKSDMTEEEEIQEALEELEKEERGVWSDTLAILADNAVTIIVLALLGAAIFGVYYIRRIRNLD